jgi:hypothetical protein
LPTGYIREWPPLLDCIKHVQRVRGGTIDDAWRKLQPALYEGKVKARLAGTRYHTFRHDGIEPSEWYRAIVFDDGSVEFARNVLLPPPPVSLGVPRYRIEVCWADVLLYWREPNAPVAHSALPKALQSETKAKPYGNTEPEPALPETHPAITERPAAGKVGRKPGSGAFDDEDALRRMLEILAQHEAPSVFAAAGMVAKAGGIKGASFESIKHRLARKFSKRYGTEPPSGKTWSDIVG